MPNLTKKWPQAHQEPDNNSTTRIGTYCGQGLCLIVTAPKDNGHGLAKRRWIYRYTSPVTKRVKGNHHRVRICLFKCDDAFGKAAQLQLQGPQGRRPGNHVKRQTKASEKSLATVWAEWINLHTKWSPRHRRDMERALGNHCADRWGRKRYRLSTLTWLRPRLSHCGTVRFIKLMRTLNRLAAHVFAYGKHKKYCTERQSGPGGKATCGIQVPLLLLNGTGNFSIHALRCSGISRIYPTSAHTAVPLYDWAICRF